MPAAIAAGVVLLDRLTKLYIQAAYTPRDVTSRDPLGFSISTTSKIPGPASVCWRIRRAPFAASSW